MKSEMKKQEIFDYLTSLGITVNTNTDMPAVLQPTAKEQRISAVPTIDFNAIAQQLEVDEKNPPTSELSIAPVVTNIFGEHDIPTLTGRVVADVFDQLIKREDAKDYDGVDEIMKLIEKSKEMMQDFINGVERKINKSNQLSFGVKRKSGTDGFHFGGEAIASRDFLFYFNKSKAKYKRNEDEIRAYITLSPEERTHIHDHFTELVMRLYDAGIDFSAKAASLFGVTMRTDNMVFYISVSDQQQAHQIIKDYLNEKNIGRGHVLAAFRSLEDGLSWAMQPSQEQHKIWREATGSSREASYNSYVAVRVMPAYLRKIADAHDAKGNHDEANLFRDEAGRLEGVIAKFE